MISELIDMLEPFGEYRLYKRINKYNKPYYILKKKSHFFFVPRWEPVFASFERNEVVRCYIKLKKDKLKKSMAVMGGVIRMIGEFESHKMNISRLYD